MGAGYSKDVVIALPCDVTNNDQVKASVGAVVEKFGRIDHVINCAGIGAVNANYTVEANDEDFWLNYDKVTDIVQHGTWRVIKAALPHLSAPGGRIVNISSVAGIRGASLTAYHTVSLCKPGGSKTGENHDAYLPLVAFGFRGKRPF